MHKCNVGTGTAAHLKQNSLIIYRQSDESFESQTRVASNVPLQLAQLDTCVIALWALVRLLVGMLVTNVTNQLARSRECRFAVLTKMGLSSRVSVDVIGEACESLEATFTDGTLVGTKNEPQSLVGLA